MATENNNAGQAQTKGNSTPDLLPVRMLNEYAYCPRLFHLMHVEGRWADNAFTIEGRHVHRRVDQIDHVLAGVGGDDASPDTSSATPDAAMTDGTDDDDAAPSSADRMKATAADIGDEPPDIARSVSLGSPSLGITAKLDLVATAGDEALPVETKRGKVPNNPQRSYDPERVQLMAQGLLLREHGYHCDHGVLYFAGSRTRVDVPFTDELQAHTLQTIDRARVAASATHMPPPLDDSPKCQGCSLAGICLPDETLALQNAPRENTETPDSTTDDTGQGTIRRLYPARDDALPLYVQEQGASVCKKASLLIIRKDHEELASARFKDISQLVLCGNIQLTTQTIHQLCEAGIPIVYLSSGHWFYGVTAGLGLRNAYDRAAQFRAVGDAATCLAFAKQLVVDKGINQRALLRRNGHPPDAVLRDMSDLIDHAAKATSIASLLGMEGSLARLYFQSFASLFKTRDIPAEWDFEGRNRRPPRDPVNAMLSFLYALLAKECTVSLLGEGLEPHWGLYHQPRHGRPALALDIMEPLRPLIADSAVITAVNTGMIRARNFLTGVTGCILQPAGRKALIQAFEARLDQLVTHPAFDYRCSWRVAIRLHARLLARYFRGDVPTYHSITTR